MNSEEKIIDYLHGRLDVKSSKEFEIELTQNPELKIAFNEAQNLLEGIKESERQELKLRLATISKDEKTIYLSKKGKLIRFKRSYLIMIAASILPLFFIVNTYFFKSNTSESTLYTNYYAAYPNTLYPIVRSDESTSLEKEAFLAYEAGDYKEAIGVFKTLLETKEDPDIRFYYAMSLLNNGKDKQASSILNNLKQDTTLYKPQTYWYAALIELKRGNKKNTVTLIDSLLLLNTGFKDTQARELQEKLKN